MLCSKEEYEEMIYGSRDEELIIRYAQQGKSLVDITKEFLEQYNETLMRIKYAIMKEDDKGTEESGIDDRDSATEDKRV